MGLVSSLHFPSWQTFELFLLLLSIRGSYLEQYVGAALAATIEHRLFESEQILVS